jgi:Phosphotransferase enzyme family
MTSDGKTAEVSALLGALLGTEAVFSVRRLTDLGRTGAFSDVSVADVRIDGRPASVVVRTASPVGPFHHPEDAARQLLWYARVSGLPRQPRVLAIGTKDGASQWRRLVGQPTIAVVEEFAPGTPYARDLDRIRVRATLTPRDEDRAGALARYLAGIHRDRRADRAAYLRGLRELVGGMEGIMSIIALYPRPFLVRHRELLVRLQCEVARRAVDLEYSDRPVARVHGDFHPGNILFADDGELSVIDRGRIEYDEPAVDVGAALVNYIALGLRAPGLAGPARALGQRFLDEYLGAAADPGIAAALPVHTAMRVAAIASPAFYPDTSDGVRTAMLGAGIKIASYRKLCPDNFVACFDALMELP